jgi:predicted phage-related endonuclease
MKILDLKHGTPPWKADRKNRLNASEAGMMMGVHPNVTRNELVEMKATGTEQEFTEWFEKNVLDKGHRVEEAARPHAQDIIGDELFPIIASDDDNWLGVSYDGQTMDESVNWECKQWNEKKAEQVRNGTVPEADYWQVLQGLHINRGSKTLYMVTDGTREKMEYIWVELNEDDAKTLEAGWRQFECDVKEYTPREEAQPVTGTATEDLPAVSVQVQGSLVVVDNFDSFESSLMHFLDEVLIREPKTDQDFADLVSQVKTLTKAETALDAAETQLLAQVKAIDSAKRRKDMLLDLTRKNRLMAEKLVESQKKAIKLGIAQQGKQSVEDHGAKVEATLDGYTLPRVPTDFNAAMKNKRTIATLRDAADNEVARAKIAINEAADLIRTNAKIIAEAGYEFLFADRQQLALKDTDFVKLEVQNRIAHHKQEEQKRIEAERARIQEEERAKAQREAQQKADAEAAAKREEERKLAEEEAAEQKQEGENSVALECAQQSASARREPSQAEAKSEEPAPHVATERPTDHQILAVISAEWGVGMETAAEWLLSMNTEKLQEMQAA